MIKHRIFLAGVAVLALVLSGCAAKSVSKDFKFDASKDEGIVVVSVTHDLAGGRAARGFFNVNNGPLEKNGLLLSTQVEVMPGITGGSDFEEEYGKLYVLTLPAGKHSITSWRLTYGGALTIEPRTRLTPLEFQVVAGEIKYLGNLHTNVRMGKNLVGLPVAGDGYPEVRDQRARDVAQFEGKYPQFKEKVKVDVLTLGPWVPGDGNRQQIQMPPMTPPPSPLMR